MLRENIQSYTLFLGLLQFHSWLLTYSSWAMSWLEFNKIKLVYFRFTHILWDYIDILLWKTFFIQIQPNCAMRDTWQRVIGVQRAAAGTHGHTSWLNLTHCHVLPYICCELTGLCSYKFSSNLNLRVFMNIIDVN